MLHPTAAAIRFRVMPLMVANRLTSQDISGVALNAGRPGPDRRRRGAWPSRSTGSGIVTIREFFVCVAPTRLAGPGGPRRETPYPLSRDFGIVNAKRWCKAWLPRHWSPRLPPQVALPALAWLARWRRWPGNEESQPQSHAFPPILSVRHPRNRGGHDWSQERHSNEF